MARSVGLIVSGGDVWCPDDVDTPAAPAAPYPGQQLVSQQFGDAARRQLPDRRPERSHVNVELADPERIAGGVEPGSWVAIFVSEDPEPHVADGSSRKLPPLTRILLPKVQVLGIGAMTGVRTVLTIAVTQAEAEKVICGSRNGDLTFALRGDRSQATARPQSAGREIAPALYGSAS